MGASPWFYVVPYEPDITAAPHALREREFQAGRDNPTEDFPGFPVNLAHTPGRQRNTIDEAQLDTDADGTRSILDFSGNAGADAARPTRARIASPPRLRC
jgi:hypothetical protein